MSPDHRIAGPFVLYFRVSTKRQGATGYGLDAQRRDVQLFLDHYSAGAAIGTFQDIESGKHDDPRRRPGLAAALDLCRAQKATLLVAKLDRLSRKVSHIAQLLDDKTVPFKVASMPFADNFQLHLYAALAEQEREFISLRTKQGLASARSRGQTLGGHRGGAEARQRAVQAIADTSALRIADLVLPLRAGNATLQQIADALTKAGIETPRGKKVWHPSSVKNVLDRLAA
ncbi:recombinase family protein [Solirhodobacter olei]|uniref:recombinase family protein n=1 Tax=Solirhodobacter olei TaxID=2493082 RepID=UPI000FD84D59|nr:recombinase family protein [Solirhodobacter olei]